MPSHKIAVLSDVHSNYEALQSVIRHAWDQGVSEIWFLGDAVGYGPEPHRCLKLLSDIVTPQYAWVLGNHDEGMRYSPSETQSSLLDKPPDNDRSSLARNNTLTDYICNSPDTLKANQINYEILDKYLEYRHFLLSHHTTAQPHPLFFLFHGGLRSGFPSTTFITDRSHVQNEFSFPVYKVTHNTLKQLEDNGVPLHVIQSMESIKYVEIDKKEKYLEIIQDLIDAEAVQRYSDLILKCSFFTYKQRIPDPKLRFFLFGHTHCPVCFRGVQKEADQLTQFTPFSLENGKTVQLDFRNIWFINPGSVGQPRDGDWRASYMIIDKNEFTLQLHRVPYNIRATQNQMEIYRFPINLTKRITIGR